MMRIQTVINSSSEKEQKLLFMKNWDELQYRTEEKSLGNGKSLLLLEVSDEEFEKLKGIFSDAGEAMGAFLTTAQENGWEEVPSSYCIYHAMFDGERVIAGIKTPEGVSIHDQLHLEEMIRKMMSFPRIVVYSSDVLTYIKDLFPEVDLRAFIIAREISRTGVKAPNLEDLGRIYGFDVSDLKNSLELIEKLLENPIRTPQGEVSIRPYYMPL